MKKLERSDMKAVMGGNMPPPATLWRCLMHGSYYANVCYTVNPEIPCGYPEGVCTAIGTCTLYVNLCAD